MRRCSFGSVGEAAKCSSAACELLPWYQWPGPRRARGSEWPWRRVGLLSKIGDKITPCRGKIVQIFANASDADQRACPRDCRWCKVEWDDDDDTVYHLLNPRTHDLERAGGWGVVPSS